MNSIFFLSVPFSHLGLFFSGLCAVPRTLEYGDTERSEARLISLVNVALGKTVCIVELFLAIMVCYVDAY